MNDTYGHDVGDQVLIQAAARLNSCLRATDTLARRSGDEFVVVVSDLRRLEDVIGVVRKLLHALNFPFKLGEYQAELSASIGIAVFPDDGHNIKMLCNQADSAMYAAKNAGGNRYAFCGGNYS